MDDLNSQLLGTSKLSACLFQALKKEELFAIAASSICKLLRLQLPPVDDEDLALSSYHQIWKKSFSFIVPNVLETLPVFKELLKDGINAMDKIESLTRIYVDTGEVYLDWILSNDTRSRQLLAALLETTRFKLNPRVPMYTLFFWNRFLDPFLIKIKRMHPHRVDDFSDFERNWDTSDKWFIDNVIPQLIMAMVSNCEWPEDCDDQSTEYLDLIHSYRWQCSDILAKIAKIVSARSLLEELCKMLRPLTTIRNPSPKVQSQIEAILFSVRSNYKVYEHPTRGSNHPLRQIFQLIPELKECHFRTRSTAIALIARHANFLDVTDETFDRCMNYVCRGLSDNRVSSDAAYCIKSVCEEFCTEKEFVSKNWPRLLSLYQKSFSLSTDDACELTRGLVNILCYVDNYDKARDWLKLLLDIPAKYLDGMVKHKVREIVVDKCKITLTDVLKRISIIWKYCRFPSKFPSYTPDGTRLVPLLVFFFQKLWPYFKEILQTYKDDDDMMEKTIRIVKHTIRNEPIAFTVCAEDEFVEVLQTTVNLYQQSPRSCFLYIISVYVDEYGNESELNSSLKECLFKVSKSTLLLLSNRQQFEDRPEIVEDYFELIVSYIKQAPHLLVQDPRLLEKIFERGLDGLLIHHRKALEAICEFYKYTIAIGGTRKRRSRRHHRRTEYSEREGEVEGEDDDEEEDEEEEGEINEEEDYEEEESDGVEMNTTLQNYTQSNPDQERRQMCVKKLLQEHGKPLVLQVLKGLMYEVMFASVNNLEGILEEIYQFDKDLLKEYMQACLKHNDINVPTEDPTPQEFLERYFGSRGHNERRRCVINLWKAAERYLLRTKY